MSPAGLENKASDPVRASYAKSAADYDRRWSFYLAATMRETLARLRLKGDEALLDVGCGTGGLLRLLSERHPGLALSGIDLSAEMLEVARGKPGADADLRQGDASALPFAGGAFDVLVSTSMFHYLPDPARCLAEFHRVLKPGGRVVITDWCDDFLACRLCSRILSVWDPAHDRIHGSREYRRIMEASPFELGDLDCYKINWLWGMMTVIGEKPR